MYMCWETPSGLIQHCVISIERVLKLLLFQQDSNKPRDLNASAQMCCSALSNINIRPVIIIVDAVNQVPT